MKETTQELGDRKCGVCMNCGRVYEGLSRKDFYEDDCPCSIPWLNWVNDAKERTFWGSPAAQALIDRVKPK